MHTTITARKPVAIALALAAVASLVAGTADNAQARPACGPGECVTVGATGHHGPYDEPLAALGGRTLAQYLADQQSRRLGHLRV
jgi:hypothetical protein